MSNTRDSRLVCPRHDIPAQLFWRALPRLNERDSLLTTAGLGIVLSKMFERLLAMLIIAGSVGGTALAQSCETASAVPADHQKVGSGSATVDYKGTTPVKGGQSVYVKIKNANVLGVSYVLTIEEDVRPPVTICTYNALLPPQATVVLSGALFAEPPISWKVTVEIGDESDAGVLTYDVYSVPPPAPPPKRKNSASSQTK